MKGLHEGENIWEHLPGMDSNPDVGDIKNFDTILKCVCLNFQMHFF